jgi:glutaredoxin
VIKLYTKTVCPKCIVAKGMLNESGVDYEVFNTDENEDARNKLLNLGFMGVPIAEYNGKFYTNNAELQELVSEVK